MCLASSGQTNYVFFLFRMPWLADVEESDNTVAVDFFSAFYLRWNLFRAYVWLSSS